MTEVTETTRYRKRGRPRKNADLTVIDGGFAHSAKRPDAPDDMTPRQKQIWRDIVSTEPLDFFASHTTRELLRDLVGHRVEIERLNKIIGKFKDEWVMNADGAKRYRELLKMRGEETRHFSLIATRLRLTNQSRYTPQAAATAGRNTAKVRPWEEE